TGDTEATASAPDLPRKMPRGATFVATLHRGYNYHGELIDNFYVSMNRSRSHWLLWEHGDNQCDDGLYSEVRQWCPARGVERQDAAAALLLAWFRDMVEFYESYYDEYTSVERAGMLSAEQVERLLGRALKKGKRDITEVSLDELLIAADYLEEHGLVEDVPGEDDSGPTAEYWLVTDGELPEEIAEILGARLGAPYVDYAAPKDREQHVCGRYLALSVKTARGLADFLGLRLLNSGSEGLVLVSHR